MAKVKMQLVGVDSNAFSIMGAFQNEAKKQGWTRAQIKEVLDEAVKGDYDHLLSTIASHVEEEQDDNFLDDEDFCEFCGDHNCYGECEDDEE